MRYSLRTKRVCGGGQGVGELLLFLQFATESCDDIYLFLCGTYLLQRSSASWEHTTLC
jgi:hypothetical protein